MSHGEMIKEYRVRRKMSRRTVADGVVSERTLQRFESGESKIDIESFWAILEKLNVQMDEYYQEYNSFLPSKKDHFRKSFRNDMRNHDLAEAYIKAAKSEYEATEDVFYLFMLIQAKSVAQRFDSKNNRFKISKKDVQTLFTYLSDVEQWGYFELAMYTNCLSIFETEYLSFNYRDVITQFKKFNYSLKHKIAFIKYLINSLLIAFERDNLDSIPDLLSTLYDETESSDLIKGRIYWKFFSRMYQTITNSIEFSGSICIEMFKMLGYPDEAENLIDLERLILGKRNK